MNIGFLVWVQADDHLYDKQGLLLVEQKGFVITTYTAIQAVYYDGISEEKQESKICNEENFDLTPIRNKFYQLAVSELTKNGFDYQVDKVEFAEFKNNSSNFGSEKIIQRSKQENQMVNAMRGDQAEDNNRLDYFPTIQCRCIVTKCNCEDVPPQTQLRINLPFEVIGDIYIRLDFGQIFPDSVNSKIEQFSD